MNMFQNAAKQKIRFESSSHASLSVEDLWDIPLSEIDEIAKALRDELKKDESSFISDVAPTNELTSLRFEVVKAVITDRLEDAAAARNASARAAKRQEIMAAIRQQETAGLLTTDLDKLYEMLEELA